MQREQIHFYSWTDFAKLYNELGQQEIIKREGLSEIFWCTPLWLHQIKNTRKEWVAGKIVEQKNPFDIILAEADQARSGVLKSPVAIQVKQLFNYPNNRTYTLKDWVVAAQKEIDKQKKISITPQGILYLASRLILDTFDRADFSNCLSELKIPQIYPYLRIVVCLNLKTLSDKHKSFVIYEIYPEVSIINEIPIKNSLNHES